MIITGCDADRRQSCIKRDFCSFQYRQNSRPLVYKAAQSECSCLMHIHVFMLLSHAYSCVYALVSCIFMYSCSCLMHIHAPVLSIFMHGFMFLNHEYIFMNSCSFLIHVNDFLLMPHAYSCIHTPVLCIFIKSCLMNIHVIMPMSLLHIH